MLKILSAAAFAAGPALSMTAFDAGPALAQAKKGKKGKCMANFFDACMKACTSRGGQPRFCPDYCTKRKAAKGC